MWPFFTHMHNKGLQLIVSPAKFLYKDNLVHSAYISDFYEVQLKVCNNTEGTKFRVFPLHAREMLVILWNSFACPPCNAPCDGGRRS